MKKSAIVVYVLVGLIYLSPVLFAEISIDDLIRDRAFSQFRLSPDGSKLGFIGEVREGFDNIYVIDLETMQSKLITGEEANVNAYAWANNNRIIYSTDGANRVYNGLYAINSDGTGGTILIEPMMLSSASAFSGLSLGARLFSMYPDDDENIIIYDRSRQRNYPDLALLDVGNGRQRTFFNNTENFVDFEMDNDGVIRFAYSQEEDGSSEVFYRKSEGDEFQLLHAFGVDYISYSVEGFSKDNKAAYVITNHLDNTSCLYELDLDTFSYNRIHEDPEYDLSAFAASGDLIFSSKSGKLLGITYEADKPKNIWFNKQFEQLQNLIDEAFPDTVNQIINWDDDQQKFIIASFSDREPYNYRLLTINPLSVTELQKSKPWIQPEQIPRNKPVQFKARDGRTIHGYLILPPEYKGDEPLPLVVLPHGGPWARDLWGFRNYLDTLQIFPATRGWAVLQVNFRGSTGYGKDHLISSYKQIHEMHHDVEDGVRWAIEQGYADPDHLGIMGASWGGYATMYGLTKTPQLYRFGVNIFGVVDVPRQINWYRLRTKWGGQRDAGYAAWARRIGDPDNPEDLAMLESASPINFIDNIQADLLIYHGTQDANVDIEQSRLLRSRLNSADVDFDWISRADEHHSIRNIENRRELFTHVEALLKKHGK